MQAHNLMRDILKPSFYRSLTASLKSRLNLLMIISSIVPILLIGGLSVYSISSILENKIDKGLQNHLEQVKGSLENTLNYLDYSSQQFTINGLIGKDLADLLQMDWGDSLALRTDMQKNINLLNFTNPTVGLTMFYDKTSGDVLFSNLIVDDFELDELPVLTKTDGATYYGPHKTNYRYNDENMVFSISRKFDFAATSPITSGIVIYVETNFKLFEGILSSSQYGMSAFHLLTDKDGHVVYSQNPELFPAGSFYEDKQKDQYRIFKNTDSDGWGLVVYVDQQDYGREFEKWTLSFLLVLVLSITISVVIAVTIRNYVYKPLIHIKNGMNLVAANKLDTKLSRSGMVEFDYIIEQFDGMNFKIRELIARLEHEEKVKRETEVAKLMAQINPHFLYNTLNTVQWLARMKGQTEIDQFIASFTKVLSYNLAKDGIMVALRDEIEVLKDYIALQQVRYDYQYDIRLDIDERALEDTVPRFLLQPLVENSLYHGLGDVGGLIEVIVRRTDDGKLLIIVRDDGYGMEREKFEQLISSGMNRSGLGIGLNYVDKTIKSHYGSEGILEMESEKNVGTTIKLVLPTEDGRTRG